MKKNMSNQNENNIVFGDDNLEQIQWNHRNRSRWKFPILLQNFKSINLIVITTIVIVIIVNNQIDSIEAVGGRGVAISSKGTRGSIGAKPVDANEDSGTLTVILVVILPVAQIARNNHDCLIGVGCGGVVKKCDDSMIAMRMINPHRFDCYPLNLKQTSNSLLLTKKMRPNFDRNRNPILKSRSSAPTIELHNLHQHCSPQSFSSSFRPRSSLITSIDCDHNDQNDQSRFVSLNESQSLTNLFSYEVLRASSNTVNQLASKRIRDHQCQYLREQLKSVPYEIRDIDPNDNHRISSATKSVEQTKKFDKNLDKNLKIFSRLGPSDNVDRNCSILLDDCDCDDSDPNLTAQSKQKRSVLKMNDCDDVGVGVGVGVGVDDCTSVMMENFDDSFESRNHHHSELNPLRDCYVTNRSVALSLPFRFESNQTMNQKKSTSNCSSSSNVSVSFQKLKHLDEPIDLQHSDSRSSTDRNESNLRLDRKPNSYVSC
ncbi:proton-coupled folate transporter-like [Sarcoptes scabiei]|nr:proton-coupled folate transporter-like [Sarcoptes scabiei]